MLLLGVSLLFAVCHADDGGVIDVTTALTTHGRRVGLWIEGDTAHSDAEFFKREDASVVEWENLQRPSQPAPRRRPRSSDFSPAAVQRRAESRRRTLQSATFPIREKLKVLMIDVNRLYRRTLATVNASSFAWEATLRAQRWMPRDPTRRVRGASPIGGVFLAGGVAAAVLDELRLLEYDAAVMKKEFERAEGGLAAEDAEHRTAKLKPKTTEATERQQDPRASMSREEQAAFAVPPPFRSAEQQAVLEERDKREREKKEANIKATKEAAASSHPSNVYRRLQTGVFTQGVSTPLRTLRMALQYNAMAIHGLARLDETVLVTHQRALQSILETVTSAQNSNDESTEALRVEQKALTKLRKVTEGLVASVGSAFEARKVILEGSAEFSDQGAVALLTWHATVRQWPRLIENQMLEVAETMPFSSQRDRIISQIRSRYQSTGVDFLSLYAFGETASSMCGMITKIAAPAVVTAILIKGWKLWLEHKHKQKRRVLGTGKRKATAPVVQQAPFPDWIFPTVFVVGELAAIFALPIFWERCGNAHEELFNGSLCEVLSFDNAPTFHAIWIFRTFVVSTAQGALQTLVLLAPIFLAAALI